MKTECLTTSAGQTRKLARQIAKEILKNKRRKRAVVLGLTGELGSGKTCFLQGFANGLGIKQRITSPTFVIMRRYKILNALKQAGEAAPTGQTKYKIQTFYHIDCYRIEKPKEILALGFKKIMQDPKNIIAIEWAERIKKILPKNAIWIKFKLINKNKRKIVLE